MYFKKHFLNNLYPIDTVFSAAGGQYPIQSVQNLLECYVQYTFMREVDDVNLLCGSVNNCIGTAHKFDLTDVTNPYRLSSLKFSSFYPAIIIEKQAST